MKMLLNRRGDAFIMALILVGILGFIFAGVQVSQSSSRKRVQNLKVRTWMTSTELRVRQALMQPQAYTGCTTTAAATTGCTLNSAFLQNYEFVPQQGGSCDGAQQCGVRVRNWSFNNSTRTVTATVQFEGGLDAKDTTISVKVPDEVLQSSQFSCPSLDPSRPVFTGIDATTGRITCRAITPCAAGTFMTGVRADTLNSICTAFPSGSASCATNQHISSFSWQGGTFTHTCTTRPNPTMPGGSGSSGTVNPVAAAGCGSSKNSCTSGLWQDDADTAAEYRWSCINQSGSRVSCSSSKKSCSPINVAFNTGGITLGKDHCQRNITYETSVTNPYAGRALFEINVAGVDDTLFIDGSEVHNNQFLDFNGSMYACNAPHADFFSKNVGGRQTVRIGVADNHGGSSSLTASVCFTELD